MEEQFETYDEHGQPLGLKPRSVVHRLGYWHKSAHVFLLDEQNRLLVQLRAAGKDIAPGHWDLSVGEHLQPGEDAIDAAARGVQEELGLSVEGLVALGEEVWQRAEYCDGALVDCEIQRAYVARASDTDAAQIRLQQEEVAQVCWIDQPTLQEWLTSERKLTPWFVAELARHKLLLRWFNATD